ncbi:hypothetical protein BJV74DRAFT_346701 [Russula compacta]|nr:hypothetical protein BJV74DRAFT_346701 [Russula compacta]
MATIFISTTLYMIDTHMDVYHQLLSSPTLYIPSSFPRTLARCLGSYSNLDRPT